MSIALKKEGRAIPRTEKYIIDLSISVSLFRAEKTPKIKPKIRANKIAKNANKKVFGKVDFIIEDTFKLDLTNEVRKYGYFETTL